MTAVRTEEVDYTRQLGFLIRDVARNWSLAFAEMAATTNLRLTPAQCKVLLVLERNQGISQVRLAELTETEPMTLVRILDRMESDGWIERQADPLDRRARRLVVKDAAKPVLGEIHDLLARSRAAIIAGFTDDEHEILLNLLNRLRSNMLAILPDLDENAGSAARVRRVSGS